MFNYTLCIFLIQTIHDFGSRRLISNKTGILDNSSVSTKVIKDYNFVLSTIFMANIDYSKTNDLESTQFHYGYFKYMIMYKFNFKN